MYIDIGDGGKDAAMKAADGACIALVGNCGNKAELTARCVPS